MMQSPHNDASWDSDERHGRSKYSAFCSKLPAPPGNAWSLLARSIPSPRDRVQEASGRLRSWGGASAVVGQLTERWSSAAGIVGHFPADPTPIVGQRAVVNKGLERLPLIRLTDRIDHSVINFAAH